MKRLPTQKHMTLEARKYIEEALNEKKSISQIARDLDRSETTIAREIKKHRQPMFPTAFNNNSGCLLHQSCSHKHFECYLHCKNFQIEICELLTKPPYTCNACNKKRICRLVKYYYKGSEANLEYKSLLNNSRANLHYTDLEWNILNNDFYTLVLQNRSIYHSLKIINNRGFQFAKSSIYRQIKQDRLALKTSDLPRFKRKKKQNSKDTSYKSSKVKDHTYEDYIEYKNQHPNAIEIQTDTVYGILGVSEPVMLTIQIVEIKFLFIFKMQFQTMEETIKVISNLQEVLGENCFHMVFEIWLTDNGHEFNNVERLVNVFQKSHIFYCHPYSSFEKGSIENNHELIRRVIPKGVSLKVYTQDDYNLLASHINSLFREELDGLCPFELIERFIPMETIFKLGLHKIVPEKVKLIPSLLGEKNIKNIKKYLDEDNIKRQHVFIEKT